MAKIKTRETVRDIKTFDRVADISTHIKNTFVKSKDTAEQTQEPGYDTPENYATDKTSSAASDMAERAAHNFKSPDKKASENINKAKQNFQDAKRHISYAKNAIKKTTADQPKKEMAKQAQNTVQRTASRTRQTADKSIKTVQQSEKTIKQSVKTIKATGKGATKTAQKSVKTAERTAKTAIKTTQQAAKTAQKTAQATAKAAKAAAHAARVTAKAAITTAKIAIKATIATVKTAIAAIKGLIAIIAAGGWIAVVIILIICMVAFLVSSPFGLFYSNEKTDTNSITLSSAIEQINASFSEEIERIKSENSHDEVEGITTPQNWRDVLSVYAVKTVADPNNPIEVATMDTAKVEILRTVFWDMNIISFELETVEHENDSSEVSSKTILHISFQSKTCSDMAVLYNFNAEQNDSLDELMSSQYDSLWEDILGHLS